MKHRPGFFVIAALALSLAPHLASAQGDDGGGSGPPPSDGGHSAHRGPPPEAVAACSGKSASEACSFTGRQGETVSGICDAGPARASSTDSSAATLACHPAHGGRPPS